MKLTNREIYLIARDIRSDMVQQKGAAFPEFYGTCYWYLVALLSLNTMDDYYGNDPAREIVSRFLVNASNWRGERARILKAELQDHQKAYAKRNDSKPGK
jgi:hypothetical protein